MVVRYVSILVYVVLTYTGCSSIFYNDINSFINPKNGTDFSSVSMSLSVDICSKISTLDDKYDLYITDFVNISNLQNRSQLGFLLSSELKVAVLANCDKNIHIKELTLGQNIKIGKQGVKIFTRNIPDLKTKTISSNGRVISGTYAITSEKLIVFTKVIDLESGDIIYSKSTSTNITNEILKLEGIDNSLKVYKPLTL
jgi:hypothetical protein